MLEGGRLNRRRSLQVLLLPFKAGTMAEAGTTAEAGTMVESGTIVEAGTLVDTDTTAEGGLLRHGTFTI